MLKIKFNILEILFFRNFAKILKRKIMENFKSFKKHCVTSFNGVDYVQFDKVLSTYRVFNYSNIQRFVFSFSKYLIIVDIEKPFETPNYLCYSVISFDCDRMFVSLDLLHWSKRKILTYFKFNPRVQCLGVSGFAFNDDYQRVHQFRSYLHRCLNSLL